MVRIDSHTINRFSMYGLIALVAFLLQTTVAGSLRLWSVAPSFAVAATILVGMHAGCQTGAVFGAALGFMCDCTSSFLVGGLAMLLMLVGLLAGILTERTLWRSLPAAFVLLSATYLGRILYALIASGAIRMDPGRMVDSIIIYGKECLVTAPWLALFYPVIGFFMRKLEEVE